MKKKILLGFGALAVALVALPMFAAFEAHVINVTAKIENALSVDTTPIDFGTVFPQEQLDKNILVELSKSFLDAPRADDVKYIIRQKPKCGITKDNGTVLVGPTATGHVSLVNNSGQMVMVVDCGPAPRQLTGNETWGQLPLLCPYLSKHKDPSEDPENNDQELDAFHQIGYIDNKGNSDPSDDEWVWNDVKGYLAKSASDLIDKWVLDLKVPCFGGNCAQDWETFVDDINPSADPDQYKQDPANEHKVFGCDLWIEVYDVSRTTPTPPEATLTVHKVVINDNGGNNGISDFVLKVSGTTVSDGVATAFAPGSYVVSELGLSGYQASFSGDCSNSGAITLVAGDSKNCTITNDDIASNVTLIKVVDSGSADPSTFQLTIDGSVVPTGSSVPVSANATHTIDENPVSGYHFVSISGAGCPASLGGSITLNEGEAITCTIHNAIN